MKARNRELLGLIPASLRVTAGFTAERKEQPKPAKAAAPAELQQSRKAIVFRNQPSWNRKRDFEEVLTELGFKFDQPFPDPLPEKFGRHPKASGEASDPC